ncbi:uncharacterized protein LOC113378248 isoform X2 [Ctenocephalides felis]|nr:uncharacterized protein LOC113378248 isoform X2 [Ctenocephalides felis]
MQWMTSKYNNNNYNSGAYGISPGKRQRNNSENKVGNKENINDATFTTILIGASTITQPFYEPPDKITKIATTPIFKTGDENDRSPVKSPEVLNLKINREDETMIQDEVESDLVADEESRQEISSNKLEKTDNKRSRKQKQPCKVAHKVTLTSIRDEFLTKHISRKSLVCTLCPKSDYAYHTKLSLEIHMSLRHSSAIIPCSYCLKEFDYDHLIKSHKRNCKDLHSAKTNNSASVTRPKTTIDQNVPDF